MKNQRKHGDKYLPQKRIQTLAIKMVIELRNRIEEHCENLQRKKKKNIRNTNIGTTKAASKVKTPFLFLTTFPPS